MKRLKRQINNHGIFVASLLLITTIVAPLIPVSRRAMTIQEFLLLDLGKNMITVGVLRLIIFGLIIFNTTLIYGLLSGWFAKRRAGLATFMLAAMPVWLLMQVTITRFTLALTPLLIALWSFHRATRSQGRASLWYALCGLATTVAWLQEPIAVTIVMAVCGLLLLAVKPRYALHITRQASLVLIILVTFVAGLSAASWKLGLGLQDYLVRQLSHGAHPTLMPSLFTMGPQNYYFGLPGVTLIPVSIMVLAGLGAWQLFVACKRPRNLYVLILPILLGAIALQFNGITSLLLLSLTMVGVAVWAVMGVQYLHTSWKRIFPHNRLANSVGDMLIVTMLASLTVYSIWFVAKAWNGSPQMREDARIEWNGTL